MTAEDATTLDETKIRELLDDWVKALRARDVDAVVSSQAPEERPVRRLLRPNRSGGPVAYQLRLLEAALHRSA